MDSRIIEEMIYGGWLVNPERKREVSTGRRGVRTVRNGEMTTQREYLREWKELVRYFSTSEEEAEGILKETGFPQKGFTAEQLLFYPEKAPADSTFGLLLNRLLELEASRLMGIVTEKVNRANNEDDRFYIVTLAMRKWSDYLVDLRESSEKSDQTNADLLSDELQKWLMVLICDLSERYSGLNLKERFSRDEIYPMLLNRKAPTEPEIFATAAMAQMKAGEMAISLLQDEPNDVNYQQFMEELHDYVIEINGMDTTLEAKKSVYHLENLILLSFWQKRAFMEENRETLLDPLAAAEWVRGVREEALDQMSNSMKKTLKKLWSIKQQMQPFLDAGDRMKLTEGSGDSEARRFMMEVEQMDQALFQQPFNGRTGTHQPSGNGESNPFIDQAGEKYMSKEHMFEYLKITHRTTRNNFLKKAGFRYIELTEHKHLVYIEDIEEYFEKNTKRYGDE